MDCRLSEGGLHLTQATGGEVPPAGAMGNRMPPVWALGVWVHLVQDKGSREVERYTKSNAGPLAWSPGGRGKLQQRSQTPDVGMATTTRGSGNRYHLCPQSPQRLAQRRRLQLSTTCCCSHSPENVHTLLLPLSNTPGTSHTCLKITVTSQGPATRRGLCHLHTGPCNCQGPSNQALATSPAHCLYLFGSSCSTQKINSKTFQNTQGY